MKRLTKLEPSSSGFILLLGVDRVHPQLAHHNIFFSHDYEDEFNDIFARGLPPREPTIYVAITAKTDAAHAPTGCENWLSSSTRPPKMDASTGRPRQKATADLVLARLAHDFTISTSAITFATLRLSRRLNWKYSAARATARSTASRPTTAWPHSVVLTTAHPPSKGCTSPAAPPPRRRRPHGHPFGQSRRRSRPRRHELICTPKSRQSHRRSEFPR
ncbi:MAG: hypothetical protein R2856_24850 [Caldilineaceae bacterium]